MFNDIRLLSTVSLKLNDCLPVVGLNTSSSVYSPRSSAGLGQEGPGCTGLVSGVVEVFLAFISSITSLHRSYWGEALRGIEKSSHRMQSAASNFSKPNVYSLYLTLKKFPGEAPSLLTIFFRFKYFLPFSESFLSG